ncbi:transposase [Jiangella alkaliphila]|uniref:transposase n=1 Tax=Jiangella alkaliphila TaxID=419479 RepID=UPI000ADD5870|nr:transposase [Jiangella alkaliphila]
MDRGYRASVAQRGVDRGIDVQVVQKDPGLKGFHPTLRWPVERTFGWLMLHRRLVRDYETLPERSRTMIHWAMIDNMSRRITGETIQTWRDEPANSGAPPQI